MNKALRIFLKILKNFVLGLLLILSLVFLYIAILLNTNYGKTTSGKFVAKAISKKTDTRVEISKANINLSDIELTNLYIYDFKDTLVLYVPKLKLSYKNIMQNPKRIKFRKMEIENAYINGVRHSRGDLFNFEYIIKSLVPQDTNAKGSKTIFGDIYLNHATVRYHEPPRSEIRGTMDIYDLYARDVDIHLKDFIIKGGRVDAEIMYVNGIEKSGFNLKNATGHLIVEEREISVSNMHLLASESEFFGYFGFLFKKYTDFADYNSKITMKADITESRLKLNDLNYFTDNINSNEDYALVSGSMLGPLDNLKGKDLLVKFGIQSAFMGNIRLTGLPEVSETFIDVDVDNLKFTFSDLTSLLPLVKFPDFFYKTGKMIFQGNYSGFLNDFVAYGSFNTPFGEVKTDINFKIPAVGEPNYSGNLTLIDFDIGKFSGNEKMLSKTSLSGSIKGKGLNLETASADVDAKADYIDFRSYRYQNISFVGNISEKLFSGNLEVKDQNMDLGFDGKIDFENEKPSYQFVANFKHTDFYKLNLLDEKLVFDGMLDINVNTKTIDDIEGRVLLLNANLQTEDSSFQINTLLINSKPVDDVKNISLHSDLIDATLSGKFIFKTLPDLFLTSLHHFFDTTLVKPKKVIPSDYFVVYDVKLYKTSFLNKILKTDFIFENGTNVRGGVNLEDNSFKCVAKLPGFSYKNYSFNNFILNSNGKGKVLNIYSSVGRLQSGDSIIAENINLSSSTSSKNIDFGLYFFDERFENHFTLNGGMVLKHDSAMVIFEKSNILTHRNIRWNLKSDTVTIKFTPEIIIPYLELENSGLYIKAVGVVSKSSPEPLRLLIDNVEFANLIPYLPWDLSMFNGTINGQVMLYDILGKFYFDAAVAVNPVIYLSKYDLGTLTISANHNANTGITQIRGTGLSQELDEIVELTGFFDFIDKKTIDMTIYVPPTDASNFEAFADYLVSDLEGDVTGTLHFKGPLDKYKIYGSAVLTDVYFSVDFTQTRYHVSDEVFMDEKGIYFKNIYAYDSLGNSGVIFGQVNHTYFNNFYLNISLIANKILALKTTEKDNTVFYGTAFASGRMDVTGPLDDIKMDFTLKSEKNTVISLISYADNTFTNYNFIRFTNVNYANTLEKHKKISGITVNLDVEVTPDALMEIIFDPVTDDVIRGNGSGNLKFFVDAQGNTSMFGRCIIHKGEYTFSALNKIYDKKFEVSDGSSITWTGDPYQADIKINAICPLKTPVYNLIKDNELISEADKDLYRQKNFDVLAIIYLTGDLFSPDVKLDFEILNTSSMSGGQEGIFLDQQVRNIKSNEQELNKQVISLLILNSFLPPETGIGTSSLNEGLNTNAGSLLSSQVNQWLSGILKETNSKYVSDIKVGVNWVAQNSNYKDQLDVLLSGNLFDDRIELSGSYDVTNVNADFQVNYNPLKNSKVRFKVFTRSDNNPVVGQDINRQGIGVFLKEDFDSWSDLFKRRKKENVVIK